MNRLCIDLSPYLYPMKREALNVPLLAKNIASLNEFYNSLRLAIKKAP
jgi:hypothetical protein